MGGVRALTSFRAAPVQILLGLPFVNADYRALARWPSYFRRAWGTLKPLVQGRYYEEAVTEILGTAVDLVRALPNPTGLRGDAVLEAAARDADVGDITEVVRLFQCLLPGLTLNAAFFREQLSGRPSAVNPIG